MPQNLPPLLTNLAVGYNAAQWQSESGISDIDIGFAMNFEAYNMTITPTIHYVIVPMSTINNENEFWAGIKLAGKF